MSIDYSRNLDLEQAIGCQWHAEAGHNGLDLPVLATILRLAANLGLPVTEQNTVGIRNGAAEHDQLLARILPVGHEEMSAEELLLSSHAELLELYLNVQFVNPKLT